jgi:tRNA(Ile)-lysidine synthase
VIVSTRLPIVIARAMDRLGPFEPRPRLAVAVSGGADSMALAILARDWVFQRDGSLIALVVDHGLRAASADEARLTIERLTGLGIPARLLSIGNLMHGSALAERARIARYEILSHACRDAGILHLLVGHHAADQMETLAMRMLRGSGPHGLACMSAIRETFDIRLLRPMLGIDPAMLREFLTGQSVEWVEDPSNKNTRALRPRLRQQLGTISPNETGLTEAIADLARARLRDEAETATELAARASIRPEGFALLSPGRIGAVALACLVQTVGGSAYPPALAQIETLAVEPRPATIAGVRIIPARRFGHGMLIVREEAAISDPIVAKADAVWDNRFRLRAPEECPEGAVMGKLGTDAARFRDISDLPSAVLRTLPAIRFDKFVAAVPHLGYAASDDVARMTLLFHPRRPLGAGCFVPAI